jgi:CubicO group peptidase (beta-lactamase class C family)
MKKAISAVLCVLAAAVSQATPSPTPENLARFFDSAVPELMEEVHVAGAVVGVAGPSRVLFLRGYGSADLETKTPVNPETTLFRPGSISKLFTWTAIMQLEEQGKLALDDPVERYLDFDIADTFEEPIRIIDLMNHTPGFADRLIGLFVQDVNAAS